MANYFKWVFWKLKYFSYIFPNTETHKQPSRHTGEESIELWLIPSNRNSKRHLYLTLERLFLYFLLNKIRTHVTVSFCNSLTEIIPTLCTRLTAPPSRGITPILFFFFFLRWRLAPPFPRPLPPLPRPDMVSRKVNHQQLESPQFCRVNQQTLTGLYKALHVPAVTWLPRLVSCHFPLLAERWADIHTWEISSVLRLCLCPLFSWQTSILHSRCNSHVTLFSNADAKWPRPKV